MGIRVRDRPRIRPIAKVEYHPYMIYKHFSLVLLDFLCAWLDTIVYISTVDVARFVGTSLDT